MALVLIPSLLFLVEVCHSLPDVLLKGILRLSLLTLPFLISFQCYNIVVREEDL